MIKVTCLTAREESKRFLMIRDCIGQILHIALNLESQAEIDGEVIQAVHAVRMSTGTEGESLLAKTDSIR